MEARTLQLRVQGMTCEPCAAAVERALMRVDGVTSAVVDLKHQRGIVQYDGRMTDPRALIDAVNEAGYEAAVLELAAV